MTASNRAARRKTGADVVTADTFLDGGELKSDQFKEAAAYLREKVRVAETPPGESEAVVRGRHLPDRRLSFADQRLQKKVRTAARIRLTGIKRERERLLLSLKRAGAIE